LVAWPVLPAAGEVSLTVAGPPAGTRATFTPNPAGSPGSSALKVKTKRWTRDPDRVLAERRPYRRL